MPQVTTWFGFTDISMVIPGCRTGWNIDCAKPRTRISNASRSIQHCLRVMVGARWGGAAEEIWPVDKADTRGKV